MRNMTPDEKLGLNFSNVGRTNLHDWIEIILESYISKQAIEDEMPLDKIKENIYTQLHDRFFCMVPKLLHKFLLNKGVGDIV
jgi:hypothetical protein